MNMAFARKAFAWWVAVAAVTATLPVASMFAGATPAPLVVTSTDLVFPQFGSTGGHSFESTSTGRGFNTSLIKWRQPISLSTSSSAVANFASDVRLNNTTSSPDVLGVVWGYPNPTVPGTSFISIGAGNNGSIMWSFLVVGNVFATPLAADLNNDGKMDVLVRADNGFVQALTPDITWDGSNWLYPFSNVTQIQAQQLWNVSLQGDASGDNNLSTPIAANLVGTPSPEVLAPAGDRLFLLDGTSGGEIRNVTVDGTIVSAPTVGTAGGVPRVYVTSTNRSAANASTVRSEFILSAFDGSLNFLWNATFFQTYDTSLAYKSLDLQLPSPAAGDLDGGGTDNDLALVTPYENSVGRLRIFYNGSNSPSVNVSLLGLTGSAPAVADLDGDGTAEIVALSYLAGTPIVAPNSQAYVEVFAGNGTRVWNATVDEVPGPPRENTLAPPAIADLNGDGVKDVVAFLTDGSTEVRSGTNGSRILRNQAFDQASPTEFSGICVADLDKDGFLDITGNAAAVSFAMADLHLNSSDIGLNNTQPEQFEDVQITATIHNGGNAPAGNVTVAFFDGPMMLAETSLPLILAGGSAQALVNVNFSSGGTRALRAFADSNHTVEELDENNNTATLSVIVTSLFGFRFESPVNRTAVQPGFAYVFILNAVSEGTGSNLVELTVGTLPVNWTASLAPLNLTLDPAGTLGDTNTSYFTVNTDVAVAVGIYDIEVRGVSANNSRNAATMVFTVIIGGQYGASLFPKAAAQNVTAGDTAIYTLEIINSGNSPDTFNFTTAPAPAGWTVTLTRSTSPPLQANGRTSFSLTVRAPNTAAQGDNATVTLTARSQNDTQKNDTAIFVTTVVVPDLVVDAIRFFRACAGEAFFGAPSLIQGENSRIQVSVRNAAENAQVSSLRVRFWVEATFTDVPTTIGADGLGYANYTFAYVAGGAKSVTADVDPGDLISELSESNNQLTAQVTVKDPSPIADVTLAGSILKGGAGVPGATVTITNTARSATVTTTAGAAGNYSVQFTSDKFLDGDRLRLDATDGLDIGNATACAYSEDVQVNTDITLGLPSPYDFLLTAAGATDGEAAPGANVTYNLTLTNRGPFNNTILLSLFGTWQSRVMDANGTTVAAVLLPPNGSAALQVVVFVPSGSPPGALDNTTLQASAAADAARARNVTVRTTAGVLRALTLTADAAGGTALAGTNLTANLTVGNAGNGEETVNLQASCDGPMNCSTWVSISGAPLTLPAGGLGHAIATIRLDPTALGGVYTINFTAFADSSVIATATFALTAIEVRYDFTVSGGTSLRLVPGELRTLSLTVTNRGTVEDTYTATVAAGTHGFDITLDPGASLTAVVTLGAGQSAAVTLSVGTPEAVDIELYPIDIVFESTTKPIQRLVQVTATIGTIYDFSLDSMRISGTPEVGKEIQVLATVSNTGSHDFTGTLSVRLLVGSDVFATATIRSLGQGRSETVTFRWTPRTAGTVNLTVDVNRGEGSTLYESTFTNNVQSLTPTVTPAQAGGFLAERGILIFMIAAVAVILAAAAVARRKQPGEEPPRDEEKAQEETEERRKGKESGGLGRI